MLKQLSNFLEAHRATPPTTLTAHFSRSFLKAANQAPSSPSAQTHVARAMELAVAGEGVEAIRPKLLSLLESDGFASSTPLPPTNPTSHHSLTRGDLTVTITTQSLDTLLVSHRCTTFYLSPDAPDLLDTFLLSPPLSQNQETGPRSHTAPSDEEAPTRDTAPRDSNQQLPRSEQEGKRAAEVETPKPCDSESSPGEASTAPESAPAEVWLVVGGLVDRRVKRGRSLRRASDELGMLSARLPLTSELTDWILPPPHSLSPAFSQQAKDGEKRAGQGGSPLNIDTVLTMLYIWSAVSGSYSYPSLERSDSGPVLLSPEFIYAEQIALAQHRRRHPNQGKHVL